MGDILEQSSKDRELNKFEPHPGGKENSTRTIDGLGVLEFRKDTSIVGRTIEGFAALGTAETASTWQIRVTDVVGTQTHIFWADDNRNFDNRWSSRVADLPGIAFENEKSLSLSGDSNSFCLGPASADYNFANTDGFSLIGWVKSTDTGTTDILHKMSGANNGYMLEIDSSNRLIFEFRGAGTGDRIRVRTDSISPQFRDGNWRFFCITKGSGSALASSVTVYTGSATTLTTEVLNVLNDTLSGTTTSATQIGIGANNNNGSRLRAFLDEFAIFNAELTLAEVTEAFNAGSGVIDLESGSDQLASAIVAYWRMGDGAFVGIPTIPDEVGTNDLTTQSAVVSGDIITETPP